MKSPIIGSCQCGQVTFTVSKAPVTVFACHCRECQKLSGSPFSVTAVLASDAISFQGELSQWCRSSDSGNQNCAKFCPDCGNRVYHFNPDDMSTIKLKLKPVELDDDALFEPLAHVWVSEKLNWYSIPEGVKVFDKGPV